MCLLTVHSILTTLAAPTHLHPQLPLPAFLEPLCHVLDNPERCSLTARTSPNFSKNGILNAKTLACGGSALRSRSQLLHSRYQRCHQTSPRIHCRRLRLGESSI